MQKIYSHPSFSYVHHVKNLLSNHGIASEVRGEHLASASGGVAPVDAWVELWLVNESQLQEAKLIVEDTLDSTDDEDPEPWKCPNCSEEIEGSFAVCWNCETERPDEVNY